MILMFNLLINGLSRVSLFRVSRTVRLSILDCLTAVFLILKNKGRMFTKNMIKTFLCFSTRHKQMHFFLFVVNK